MGTNYYWHPQNNKCPACGRSDGEELHIGKSSAGWCFGLRIYPEKGIHDLPDWIQRWEKSGEILDEYGSKLTMNEMLAVIMIRWTNKTDFDPHWLEINRAAPGPFGLARHGYARPGSGPYDLCDYEFSQKPCLSHGADRRAMLNAERYESS